jgi:aspartyl-tRNA(Asn)/glutamyl-tRNA(Gln) amidotransferase subunit A
MTRLHELGVAEIAERVRTRDVSALEVIDDVLQRIEATEPQIRAWVSVDTEGARTQARQADAATARGDGGPLNGVPVGLKDIYDAAGFSTRCGSTFLPDVPKEKDAASVARLRRSGAIVIGKTVTTPFAYADPPVTRNPWNQERTPGGSSSGSAAAVGAWQIPAAMGSQTAGSICRPAGYCGAVGLKPTFGRVSRQGIHPLSWSLDHAGPIARTVVDAAMLLQVLAGYDAADQGSRDRPIDDYVGSAASPRVPRLGLLTDVVELAQPDVRAHALEVAERLRNAGALVNEITLAEPFELMLASQAIIMQSEAGALHAAQHREFANQYPPRLRAQVEVGQLMPAPVYLQAQRLRRRIRVATLELFQNIDALLMPTAANVAPGPSTTGDNRFQAIWSLLGFPTISLPSGLNQDGLPFSTQLIARPWAEAPLFAAAAWCESVFEPLPNPFD